jgi:tryptophan synthase beta chain
MAMKASAIQESIIGHFGPYGGRFVPEALIEALDSLTLAYEEAKVDPAFIAELDNLHKTYTGRPSIITEVPRFAEHAGGARGVGQDLSVRAQRARVAQLLGVL